LALLKRIATAVASLFVCAELFFFVSIQKVSSLNANGDSTFVERSGSSPLTIEVADRAPKNRLLKYGPGL
jgi:hypothetical protein